MLIPRILGTTLSTEHPVVDFYLKQTDNKLVHLMAKLPDGKPWYILSINANGTIQRSFSVHEELGLDTDDGGRVKIT